MTISFDPVRFANGILMLLLIFGSIPFTATWVGIILLLTQVEFKLTWRRR